jgi:hypothetical protein
MISVDAGVYACAVTFGRLAWGASAFSAVTYLTAGGNAPIVASTAVIHVRVSVDALAIAASAFGRAYALSVADLLTRGALHAFSADWVGDGIVPTPVIYSTTRTVPHVRGITLPRVARAIALLL